MNQLYLKGEKIIYKDELDKLPVPLREISRLDQYSALFFKKKKITIC